MNHSKVSIRIELLSVLVCVFVCLYSNLKQCRAAVRRSFQMGFLCSFLANVALASLLTANLQIRSYTSRFSDIGIYWCTGFVAFLFCDFLICIGDRVAEVGSLSVRAKIAKKFSSGAYLLFSRQMCRFCALQVWKFNSVEYAIYHVIKHFLPKNYSFCHKRALFFAQSLPNSV